MSEVMRAIPTNLFPMTRFHGGSSKLETDRFVYSQNYNIFGISSLGGLTSQGNKKKKLQVQVGAPGR